MPGFGCGRFLPRPGSGELPAFQRLGGDLDLAAGRVPIVTSSLRPAGSSSITLQAQLVERDAQRRELLADVIFFVRVLEVIGQAQAFAQLFVNPQRDLASPCGSITGWRRGLVAHRQQRIVAFQVGRFGQDHIGKPCGVVQE